jgi:hypothetical protein
MPNAPDKNDADTPPPDIGKNGAGPIALYLIGAGAILLIALLALAY